MDSRYNFINKLRQMIETVDEDYLIGISNKGIYNRAVKDMGSGEGICVSMEEASVRVSFPDGNSCELTADIRKNKCTCPSRSMCKHVLMGILYLKNNMGALFGDISAQSTEKNEAPDYSPVLRVTSKELKRLAGDKAFDDILFRLRFGVRIEIEESSLLTVRFPDEGISVRFLPGELPSDSVCSCKSGEFCRHKAEAVLHYKISKGEFSLEEVEAAEDIDIPADTLERVKKFIEELFALGLSRMPETAPQDMEQMAVICHSMGLANLEKLFRRLKSDAELYFRKDASFSRDYLRNTAVMIFGICLGMLGNNGNTKLVKELKGEQKSAYHDMPPIELSGLGAEAWNSKSGYEGLTFYFFSEKLDRILTYSNSRPTYYDGSSVKLSRLYKAAPPWGMEGSCEEFSKSRISIVNGRINEDGRLSSSEQTVGKSLGRSEISRINLSGYVFDDWRLVVDRLDKELSNRIYDRDENYNLMILKIGRWGKSQYDNIKQLFIMPLFDCENNMMRISMQYTDESKILIERLESMERREDYPSQVLCRVYINESGLVAVPITAYYANGRMENLTLE